VIIMDLRQVKYFVTLYNERSMTKAAARLNVVQPALSMQISRLEGSFKTKLFHRTSRGVVPTDTGRTFYGLCQKILTDVDEAQRYLRDASSSVTGEITIGIMPSVANSVLADVLAQYNASYPDVTVRVMEAYSGNLLHQLQSAQLDLAIINKLSRPERVGILPLFNDHLVLITRPSRGSRASSEIASYRLPDFRLVLPSPRHGMRALLDSILASKGIVLKPEIELDSLGPTLELVQRGDWATILPVIAVKQAVDRKLVRSQRIVDPDIPREVVVATSRTPSLAAELFIQVLGERANALLQEQV
jgi:LysR family nitrogen assimilation transcriptional regulator